MVDHHNNGRVRGIVTEDRTPVQAVSTRSPAEDSLVAEVDVMLGRFGQMMDEVKEQLEQVRKGAEETSASMLKLPKQLSRWKLTALFLTVFGGGSAITSTKLAGYVEKYDEAILKQAEDEKKAAERNEKIDALIANSEKHEKRFKEIEDSVKTLSERLTELSVAQAKPAARHK